MPTIDEIRDMIKEHQDYGYTDISLDIAVTLLAEVDTLTTLAYKVCIGHVSLEQHAAHVDELKAYLTKDAYEND